MKAHVLAAATVLVMVCSTASFADGPRLNNGIIDTPFEKSLFPNKAGVQWRTPGRVRRGRVPGRAVNGPRLNNGVIDTPFEKFLFPNKAGVRWR